MNNKTVIYILVALCAASVVAQFIVGTPKPHFGFDHIPGGYGLMGVGGVLIVFALGKLIAPLVRRDPDFYDKGDGHE